jgi:hypothetical protein
MQLTKLKQVLFVGIQYIVACELGSVRAGSLHARGQRSKMTERHININ